MVLIISPKQAYITARLQEEAGKADVAVDIVTIEELADRHFVVEPADYDCLYIRYCYPYFLQTVELAQKFIAAGKKVVDADIASGHVGEGKMVLYQQLMKAGLPVPKTEWLQETREWEYPSIAKWMYGFGGKEVFLIKSPDDLKRASNLVPPEELMLQEFIAADFEYKVITVGYKALPVVLRFEVNKQIWRPDFGKAEVFTVSNPTPEFFASRGMGNQQKISGVQDTGAIQNGKSFICGSRLSDALGRDSADRLISIAEQSSRLLKRELAKTDILQKGDKFYILEVNRWPGLKSFEELTGSNVVAEFLKYIVKT